MRSLTRIFAIVAMASVMVGVAPTAAASPQRGRAVVNASGAIMSVTGKADDVWIVRAAAPSRKEAAAPNTYLFAGDRVFAQGRAFADVMLAGRTGRVRVTGSSGPLEVPARSTPGVGEKVLAFFDGLRWPFAGSDRQDVQGTYTRGSGDTPATAVIATSRFQQLPVGIQSVTVAWNGNVDELVLTNPQQRMRRLRQKGGSERTFSGADITELASIQLVVDGKGVAEYDLEWTDLNNVPRPEWLTSPSGLNSDEEVAWAAWLIENKHQEFALFALSLLSQHRASNFSADWLFMTLLEQKVSL